MSHNRNKALDGLRGVACLAVIVHHGAGVLGGALGVDVFFVLSGWLITGLLVKEFERTGGIGLRAFWRRRAIRLLPALIAGIVFAVLVTGLMWPASWDDTLKEAAAALVGLEQFLTPLRLIHSGMLIPTWSLGVETTFYLAWPLALAAMLRWRRHDAGMATACITALAVTASFAFADNPAAQAMARGSGILLGSTLALGMPRPLSLSLTRLAPIAAIGSMFMFATAKVSVWPLMDLSAASVVVALAQPSSGLTRLLQWRPLVWVGERSYAAYLFNFPCVALFLPVFGTGWGLTLASGTATLAMGALSLRLLERPAARYFANRRTTTRKDRTPALEGSAA